MSERHATPPPGQTARGDAYERILDRLEGVKRTGDKAIAKCPSHKDRSPSLSIRRFPQRVRIKCFTGCTDEAVLDALGLTVADLFDDPKGSSWSYPDGWQVFRSPDKKIRQQGPKSNGSSSATALYRADMVERARQAGREIYLVEGEPDAEAIIAQGEAATTSRMGAGSFHLADVGPLVGADVIAVPDQDSAGEAWVRAVKDALGKQAGSLTFLKPKTGKDVSDHLTAGHELADLEPYTPVSALLAKLRTGDWLDAQQFNPLQWIVRELFPEGFSLLVGAPKIGKSWMSLSIALAVAAGGYVFGRIKVEQRPVLLLALEDSDRRLQDRIRKLLGPGEAIPPLLNYLTWIEPGTVGATIRDWLEMWPADAKPLVILDTLGKVLPPSVSGESSYSRDYKISGALKRLCDERPGSALIGLHHDRKSAAEDFVEAVSGTHGLAGAADTVVVIKRQRNEAQAQLKVTGRDVKEAEYQLELKGGTTWSLVGDGLLAAARAAEEEEIVAGLGDKNRQIVRFVRSFPEGVRSHEVAKHFGLTQEEVGRDLYRLKSSGRLNRLERGLYIAADEPLPGAHAHAHVGGSESDESDELKSTNSSDSSLSSHSSGGTHTHVREEDTLCAICGHVLHPSLVAAGETTHPNC